MNRRALKSGDLPVRHKLQSRLRAESKLRRGGRNCPVCLKVLPKIAGKGRSARRCLRCEAQHHPGNLCTKCHQEAVWVANVRAACQSCGHHGSRVKVVVGAADETGVLQR